MYRLIRQEPRNQKSVLDKNGGGVTVVLISVEKGEGLDPGEGGRGLVVS